LHDASNVNLKPNEMKTKIKNPFEFKGAGAGLNDMSHAINTALAVSTSAPLLAVAKSELVRACGAGLVAYAPRDWSPNRKQWAPVAIWRRARGAGRGHGTPTQETPAAAPVVNAERLAFEVARDLSEQASIAAELDKLRALRVVGLAIGAGEVVAMAPLGEGKASKSRALIDRGGEAGEDEARQCQVERLQRIERIDNGPLLNAAATLGERYARGWVRRESIVSAIRINEQTAAEVAAIFRAATVAAVMSGEAADLLACRAALKSSRRAAFSEVYRASGRHGQDEAMADWDDRPEFSGHGSMPRGQSSAPDRSAGAGLRPSVVDELAEWGESTRTAAAAKLAAASTPAAKGKAIAANARRVALVQGLFDHLQGGPPIDEDLIAEYFDGGATNGPISDKGRQRLKRMRDAIA
jgi:hypothetical protein